jgi:16S rRNA (uracil1498-N3)-methyltransferase
VRRFFVRPDAVEAGRVRFDVDEARHLRRVLRLTPGSRVEATDGTGRGFIVRLVTVGADGAVGVIESEVAPGAESPCAITLGQAILKGDRMTWLVQKATELGVARIVPLETARVVARPGPGGAAGARRRRWERVARETMKQCGRSVAPVVDEPRPLVALLRDAPAHDLAWLFWEGGGDPIGRARADAGRPHRVLVLVGPEGGFTPDEVDLARAAGARIVSLGPRTLRAESAGVVAVALCQHVFGDLG